MIRSFARVLTVLAALSLLATLGGLAGCETPSKADPAIDPGAKQNPKDVQGGAEGNT